MSLPYHNATAGTSALNELQRILERFGCSSFGTMQDMERGITRVQFQWRGRTVDLQASWKGYAAAWLKENPYTHRRKGSRSEWETRALKQGQVAVCSILRDWVKAQVTAVEVGIMSFEAVFMSHMLLPSGERLIDRVQTTGLLPPPKEEQ